MWVESARWALGLVLLLAVAEKAAALRSGAAQWHPVMLVSEWRRTHASILMLSSLVADTAAALCLVIAPPVGSVIAVGLVTLYTIVGIRAHVDGGECRCFWRVLNAGTLAGLIVRNTLLVLLAFVSFRAPATNDLAGLVVAPGVVALVAVVTRVADEWSRSRQRHAERAALTAAEGSAGSARSEPMVRQEGVMGS